MILSALLAILLALMQTPQPADDGEPHVFIDLGTEHCAEEVAIAAFENTDAAELAAAGAPAYVTYSAFEFGSAEQANAALDDLDVLVAETFSDYPNVTEREAFDEIIAPARIPEMGDRSAGYVMNLPLVDGELEALYVNVLGIIEENQMMLILMFEESEAEGVSPGLSAEALLPFTQMLDDWDGTGDVEDAIPGENELPIGWEGRDVTTGELPTC